MKISNVTVNVVKCKMHSCLRHTMRVSRWVGMFPVEGLDKRDIGKLRDEVLMLNVEFRHNRVTEEYIMMDRNVITFSVYSYGAIQVLLRFNMMSLYTLYYVSSLTMQAVITGFMVHWFLISDLNLKTLSNLAFYVTGLTSALLLLKLAMVWPSLIKRAAKIEQRLSAIHVTKIRAIKFSVITHAVLILGGIEHGLSAIHKCKNLALCYGEDFGNEFENVCHFFYPFIFSYVPCNYFTFFVSSLANSQATFLWNFTDVMTICFSLYLTSYFRDLNSIISSQQENKTLNWGLLRYYYSQLVALVQAVDSKMCYLLLLSIFTNLFFICLQLYNTLNFRYSDLENCPGQRKLHGTKVNIQWNVNLFYYAYSFAFLMLRAAGMFFLAANVNTVATEPKYALYGVRSQDYNIHVQRFHRQLRYTTTALSGLFFYVTREMILEVIATIITYELVLLQFRKED